MSELLQPWFLLFIASLPMPALPFAALLRPSHLCAPMFLLPKCVSRQLSHTLATQWHTTEAVTCGNVEDD